MRLPIHVFLCSLIFSANLLAETENIECKLVVRVLDEKVLDTPIGENTVEAVQFAGVAVCDDGRIANKEFVNIIDAQGATGSYSGYSAYTYENGDSLVLSFTGSWGENGNRGDYKILDGAGKYAGASGTGTFEGLDSPWENADLLRISLQVVTK